MPKFQYEAIDSAGRKATNTQDAASENVLINILHNQGLTVVSINNISVSKTIVRKRKYRSHVTKDDQVLLARQIATMLESGVPLLRGLEIVTSQIEAKPLYLAMMQVREDVEAGLSFKEALEKHPKHFNKFWINLIEAGEAGGQLPASLHQIAVYMETAGSLEKKVISALIYPAVLCFVAIVAILVFTLKVIPVFSDIFDSFDMELPALTNAVIGISTFIREKFIFGILAIAAAVYLIRQYVRTESGRYNFDKLILQTPLLGNVVRNIAVQRFASGMSTLIESGVPILRSLDIMVRAAGNKIIEGLLEEVHSNVREGKTIAEPLEKSDIFPIMVPQMIRIGEESGELAKMLKRIADYYDEQVATLIGRLTALAEPVLLILMGVLIGTLVISMFLPIFKLSQIGAGT